MAPDTTAQPTVSTSPNTSPSTDGPEPHRRRTTSALVAFADGLRSDPVSRTYVLNEVIKINCGVAEAVAARCYLSINSVQTFIRAAYRKIGVERRVEAAMWVAEHLDTGSHAATDTPSDPAATAPGRGAAGDALPEAAAV